MENQITGDQVDKDGNNRTLQDFLEGGLEIPLPPRFEGIPAELRDFKQWVCWDADKVPLIPNTLVRASSTNRETWRTFDEASGSYKSGGYAGIGFVVTADDPYTVIDLDHCVDQDDVADWAMAIVRRLDSYTELSPSATGIHIFVRGNLPPDSRRRTGNIEMYDSKRYITVTGWNLAGMPRTIESRTSELEALHGEIFGVHVVPNSHRESVRAPTDEAAATHTLNVVSLSDEDVLEAARQLHPNDFAPLFAGLREDFKHASSSESDFNLCCMLAEVTTDAEQIDRLFRRSKLTRGKWDEPRGMGTYGTRTIANAVERVQQRRDAARTSHEADDADEQLEQHEAGDGVGDHAHGHDAAHTGGVGAHYLYDERNGLTFVHGSRRSVPVANFDARIVELVEIDAGDGDLRKLYQLELRKPDRAHSIEISSDDFSADRQLKKFLVANLPPEFIVYPDGYRHLHPAALERSSGFPTSRREAAMGWIERDGAPPAYLLPGAEGAVTADGLDSSVRFFEDGRLSPRMKRYGVGFRPAAPGSEELSQALDAFMALLRVAPANVAVPIVHQILAGPLTRLGIEVTPPLVHAFGETGSFKTAFATCALSIFGRFDNQSIPETWGSTPYSIQYQLSQARDVTLLVDDYKEGVVGKNRPAITNVIQAYADRTTRGRLTPDQRARQSAIPRGLLLSTGEDTWDDQQSVMARTTLVPVAKGVINRDALTVAQAHARAGRLAVFGASFVAWMARTGLPTIKERYGKEREQVLHKLQTGSLKDVHDRVKGQLASLVAMTPIVEMFLKDVAPKRRDLLDEYLQCCQKGWNTLRDQVLTDAEAAGELSPFRLLIETLRQAIFANEVALQTCLPAVQQLAEHEKATLGGFDKETVGFFDGEYVYLSEPLTYEWFKKRKVRSGGTVTFSWKSFLQEAKSTCGVTRVQINTKGRIWVYRIPLNHVFPDGVEAAAAPEYAVRDGMLTVS